MKSIVFRITFLVVILFFSLDLGAQPGGGGKCPPKNKNCKQVPITGIEYLIGLGGLYGAKKLFSNRSKKKTNE
jgi:hypothetical protein